MSEVAGTHSSARSARWVAAGILLSRLAGLLRELVTASYLGTSAAASVFRVALRMPNILQNLLGEGTLSASFIPVYSKLLAEGREEDAGRVAGVIFALVLALAGGLALIGILLAPYLVPVFVPGYLDRPELISLTVKAVRIIFPMTGILVLSAWALGVLNSHRHFFISYVAPVLWNGTIIATLFIFGGHRSPEGLVTALAWGALIGGILQFLLQLPWVLALERNLSIGFDTHLEEVREAVRNAGPAILGRGSVQLSGWIELLLVSFLWAGAAATMGYAQTFYLLPISLFGMSVAAAELPELSRGHGGPVEGLRLRLSAGLERIAYMVVPSMVGYLALGDIIIGGLYQRREFTGADTTIVYLTLAAFSVGLLASTSSRLYSSTFFALRDTKTPAWIAFARVGSSALIGGTLMFLLERLTISGLPLGVVGLALGTGIASWIEWGLLRRVLGKRIGSFGVGLGRLSRMFFAALVAAGLSRGILSLLVVRSLLGDLVITMSIYGLTYLIGTSLLGIEGAADLIGRFRRGGRG